MKTKKKKLSVEDYLKSKFFKAVDHKRDLLLTIKGVTEEEMLGGDMLPVVWFEEDERGLVLSAKTNIRVISDEYGDFEDWPGGKVILFSGQAHNPQTGKMGPALRVRIPTEERDEGDEGPEESGVELANWGDGRPFRPPPHFQSGGQIACRATVTHGKRARQSR